MELPHDDLIWQAGFYEGEGSVCVDISHGNRFIVSIAQNDPAPLEFITKQYGGSVRQRVRKSPASDKICTSHEWKIQGERAYKFMRDIRPYMRIPYKIRQQETIYERSKTKSDRVQSCKQCDKTYHWLVNLSRHVTSKHKVQFDSATQMNSKATTQT